MIKHEPQVADMPILSESHQAARSNSIEATIKRLSSENAGEREEAEQALRSLLEKDVRTIQRNRMFLYGFSTIYSVTAVPLQVYYLLTNARPDLYADSYLILLAFLGLASLIAVRQRKVGRRLAALDTPQVVGPLVDVLATSGIFRWNDIRKALIRLLPRLKASDAKWLNPRQMKYLLGFLKSDERWPYYGCLWGADLKIAILRALEQIGDSKAIPRVERLAQSSKNGSVRIAAQECLPFLRERIEEQQAQRTLLRAAFSSSSPGTLLRPAGNNIEDRPEQLLRADTKQ